LSSNTGSTTTSPFLDRDVLRLVLLDEEPLEVDGMRWAGPAVGAVHEGQAQVGEGGGAAGFHHDVAHALAARQLEALDDRRLACAREHDRRRPAVGPRRALRAAPLTSIQDVVECAAPQRSRPQSAARHRRRASRRSSSASSWRAASACATSW